MFKSKSVQYKIWGEGQELFVGLIGRARGCGGGVERWMFERLRAEVFFFVSWGYVFLRFRGEGKSRLHVLRMASRTAHAHFLMPHQAGTSRAWMTDR